MSERTAGRSLGRDGGGAGGAAAETSGSSDRSGVARSMADGSGPNGSGAGGGPNSSASETVGGSAAGPGTLPEFSTLRYEEADGVAWVTLDRPERHNAFNLVMIDEIHTLWKTLRYRDQVRCVVLTGSGDQAFCTGIDRDTEVPQPTSPYVIEDPAIRLGPKTADLWKPVIVAVNGMACGGAFYLIGECEFVIAAEHATFFDPHVSYGMVTAFETVHLAQRMPHGELARLALLGVHERMTARRACEIGLVSEVVPDNAALREAAGWAAAAIAAAEPTAVQGTVRALWAARELSRGQALGIAPHLVQLGNLTPERQAELFARRPRGGGWRAR